MHLVTQAENMDDILSVLCKFWVDEQEELKNMWNLDTILCQL
jgi:hypothetical protein